MMPVGMGCYCSCRPWQMGVANTSSSDGGSEVEWWSHGWCIVGLALSERRPIALMSARGTMSGVCSAEGRCRSRLLKW